MRLLDFLFPKYCVRCKKIGDYICPNCFSLISFHTPLKCLVCDKGSFNGLTHPGCKKTNSIDGAFSSIAYKGVVKKLLYTFKYKPYLLDLQHVLGDLFYEGIIQHEGFMSAIEQCNKGTIILVPIPLHSSKLKIRGYNQAEVLAQILGKQLKIPVVSALERVKQTKPQYGLKKEARFENIEGAFKATSHQQLAISKKNVLLVDDLLTTGATLSAATKVLKKANVAKVWGITLAIG